MAKWTEEQKVKALAIAEASSAREASKQLGIPLATIGRWMGEVRRSNENGTEHPERNGTSKKIQLIAEQAIEEAKVEVREYVVDRVKQVSDGLLELVELAKVEAIHLIQSGHDPTDSKAQWLRSVVGAIAQGVEKYQLLTGKATSRQEVNGEVSTRNEQQYHFIYEVVNTNDDIAEQFIQGLKRTQGDSRTS